MLIFWCHWTSCIQKCVKLFFRSFHCCDVKFITFLRSFRLQISFLSIDMSSYIWSSYFGIRILENIFFLVFNCKFHTHALFNKNFIQSEARTRDEFSQSRNAEDISTKLVVEYKKRRKIREKLIFASKKVFCTEIKLKNIWEILLVRLDQISEVQHESITVFYRANGPTKIIIRLAWPRRRAIGNSENFDIKYFLIEWTSDRNRRVEKTFSVTKNLFWYFWFFLLAEIKNFHLVFPFRILAPTFSSRFTWITNFPFTFPPREKQFQSHFGLALSTNSYKICLFTLFFSLESNNFSPFRIRSYSHFEL